MKPLPSEALTRAQLLVGAVHDEGAQEVAAILAGLTTTDLYALCVTLAAMVPDDRSVAELLAWNDHPPVLPFPRTREQARTERGLRLLEAQR